MSKVVFFLVSKVDIIFEACFMFIVNLTRWSGMEWFEKRDKNK